MPDSEVTASADELAFVDWLKSKGIYNEFASTATMRNQFSVWEAAGKPKAVPQLTEEEINSIAYFIKDGCIHRLSGWEERLERMVKAHYPAVIDALEAFEKAQKDIYRAVDDMVEKGGYQE